MRCSPLAKTQDRRRGERGASIIEAAFVTPVFVLLIFGIFEMGFLLRNYTVVSSSSADAARAAAVYGNLPEADFLTLQTLEHSLNKVGLENIEVLVIYHATGPGDSVPAGCLSVPPSSSLECNRYTPADFFLNNVDAAGVPTGYWGCAVGTSRDSGWCPTSRETAISSPTGPDHVGVYIEFKHTYITGVLGTERTITADRIARLEASEN